MNGCEWIYIYIYIHVYIYIYMYTVMQYVFFCSMFLGYNNDLMEFTLGAQQWTFDKRLRLDGVNTTRTCFMVLHSQFSARGWAPLVFIDWSTSPWSAHFLWHLSPDCWIIFSSLARPCHDISTDSNSNIPYSCWSIASSFESRLYCKVKVCN